MLAMASLTSLPSVLVVLALLLLPTYGMCPAQCQCTNKTVTCKGGSLSHVPHFLNPDIELLDISDNQIVKLESGLTYYIQLDSINFSRNSLRSLGRDQFMSQTSLRSLDLSSNLLSKIRVGAFNGLESLDSLSMRSNRIERLNSAVFTGLVRLKTLDLSYNNISEIEPKAFKYLRNLELLNLRRNSLSVLGDWTAPLQSLRQFDLSQNVLVSLNSRLGLGRVESVSLSDNMIVEISDAALQGLTSLSSLDLSYNKISAFPSVSGVRELSMSGNMIKAVERNSLEGLPNLEVLHLTNMPVLQSIKALAFMSCPQLTSLSLSSNRRLAPLPPGLFSTTPNLSRLDLSNLQWSSLTPDQLPVSPARVILSGVPLQCDCSLLWLWELQEIRQGLEILEGATCDGKDLAEVDVDSLACHHLEWGLIIGCVGGSVILIILIVIVAVVVKLYNQRKVKYHHCDYLQYNTNVMKQPDDLLISSYIQPSPSHQIYCEIDRPHGPPCYPGPDQIYYTVGDGEKTLYSSSGSASSDQNTSSTECSSSMPLTSYCSPGTPRRQFSTLSQRFPDRRYHHDLSPVIHFNTGKKRTLVQYNYPDRPDVLPSENMNQNYYV